MDFRKLAPTVLQGEERERAVRGEKRVVFFPTAAASAGATWRVPVHGWVYRPAELSRLRRVGLWMARRLASRRAKMQMEDMKVFRQRAGAFLADNSRGERVDVQFGDERFAMKRSRANGHFKGEFEVAGHDAGWLDFSGELRGDAQKVARGRAMLLPEKGLSVISDIDDTIKITEVLNRRKMLRKTFLEPFASVPAMAALYRQWAEHQGAAFHYVSASPWHLYPFLAEFLDAQGFPEGTFHLRDFRLMPRDLRKTLKPSRRVKLRHASELLERFPSRRFWLVGDSGESDASMYAGLWRKHPEQIEKICIRNVTGNAANFAHWQKVFQDVPTNRWQLFSKAEELLRGPVRK